MNGVSGGDLYRLEARKVEHKEIMLPGCSEDVGGGLKPDEQKPVPELCRVALHTMYNAAFRAGVPFFLILILFMNRNLL